MIFPPATARAIAAGRKTMCRVLVREPRLTRRSIRVNGERRYYGPEFWTAPFEPKVGAVEPVQIQVRNAKGRLVAQSTGARVVITAERQEALGAITLVDALAEGHRTTDDFRVAWVRGHDAAWIARQEGEPTDSDLLARFNARHAARLVWVVTFVVDREHRPTLLAAHSEELYTENPGQAMRGSADAGEALDAVTLAAYTADAHERHLGYPGRREEALRRQAQSLAATLKKELILASQAGRDATTQLDQVQRAVDELRRARAA